jgi:exosortase
VEDVLAGQTAPDRLLAVVAVLVGVAMCGPAVTYLYARLGDHEFYGHAFALPAVAAFLAYGNRMRIRRALRALEPPRLGALVVFAAATFELLMLMGNVIFLAGVGVPLLFGALAYGIGGRRLLEPLLLPLAFLALMVPPPGFVMEDLLLALKGFVSVSSVAVLRTAGAVVTAEGNEILVPGHRLFMADACSGLTSIVTMLPIAFIVAFFLSRGLWRRAVIVASVVPVAVAANILRVVITVSMVSRWGVEVAQDALHGSLGVGLYAVGTLTLIGVARLLR